MPPIWPFLHPSRPIVQCCVQCSPYLTEDAPATYSAVCASTTRACIACIILSVSRECNLTHNHNIDSYADNAPARTNAVGGSKLVQSMHFTQSMHHLYATLMVRRRPVPPIWPFLHPSRPNSAVPRPVQTILPMKMPQQRRVLCAPVLHAHVLLASC